MSTKYSKEETSVEQYIKAKYLFKFMMNFTKDKFKS